MSFLVELGRNAYPANALNGFVPDAPFSLDNARAMMWMSQLAYETANISKIDSILDDWRLTKHAIVKNNPITGLPPHSACAVLVGGRGATILAFSGTDPLKIEDWITDFTIGPLSVTELHRGFEAAVETVWPIVQTAIANRKSSEQALFLTGHSLGGALAIIAAQRAMRDLGVQATAVYTFGSPRVGGIEFRNSYALPLGDRTFRLVNGTDIVATVPPDLNKPFLHVGRSLQCPTDGRFDIQTNMLGRDENKPNFLESGIQSGLADLRALAPFRLIRAIGPRPLDRLAALLPRMVRDHVPASYFRALSVMLR